MPANVVETSRDELNATCMRKPAGNGRLKVDVTVVHNGHNLTDPDVVLVNYHGYHLNHLTAEKLSAANFEYPKTAGEATPGTWCAYHAEVHHIKTV